MPIALPIQSKEALDNNFRQRSKCMKRVKKYEGFDTTDARYGPELQKSICDERWSPCCTLVRLYARMGLHRYNLLQGKNLQLNRVKKYNMSTHSAACNYYITLVAMDPARSKLLNFQTKVGEERFGKFILTSDIARPRGENTEDGSLITEHYFYVKGSLPTCPPEDLFQNSNRFYVVEESELQVNDWIRLYLELAVATTHRSTGRNHDLSGLKIMKVAIDTCEDVPNEASQNAINAIVYIRYKDFCESRVGKDVDRIAIVKRSFNERNGCFILEGQNEVIKS
ncbi:LOW QUALITY PROTEIN: UPF0725 protein At3g57210 [Arabidopsis lyrata subsp. lyrata]|uniref:LOW QUALITY PROTEIN: UPF0725 protein At3g57210 n=1 Tax=Arabidopsis lyrata subsp. lyrata TaxID=81972 RepID=UPI000A29DADF|nr:LOW QUALITY PROTEIN: UPF0725 protein At3g57210 [Arabidopsis lyrata subsp. lyrata]|eukprot:XP_002870599.2 LOW QUALITY PROTEIN: UPF0725 protein At3g57210 [Arabidopsis lyrata subsp. lyrata]